MIDILIPTYRRPDKLAALVENIHDATESEHTICLIAETHDLETLEALEGLDAEWWVGQFGSYARAVNHVYPLTDGEFFAVGNDDVVFYAGWDTKALARMSDIVHIVGLNDGGGDCKCFTLARRSFIVEHSGVFDQPNTVYHEYQSQCVDTEFAHYAQLRGVWADAPDAVVEHIHWRLGKAGRDHPNYVKARESNAQDLAEYNRRRDLWDPQHLTPPCTPVL